MLCSIFADGERVDVIGTGRGKGFQGVVKRHHFAGGAATHGSMFHRAPGSIGASSFPSRVIKGMRGAGRMGGGRVTIHNLKVLRVDADNHLLIVEGGVPGAPTGYVLIRKAVAAKKHQGRAGREAEEGQEVALRAEGSGICSSTSSTARTRRSASVDVRDEVFGGRVKADLIWESVVRANAAERRGTHRRRTARTSAAAARSRGGRRAPAARASGEIRNPLWRKGGTVFGPQPRSYDYQLPKKVERGALRAALAQKFTRRPGGRRRRARRRRDQDEGGGGACWSGSASPGRPSSSTWPSTTTSRVRCGTCRGSASCASGRVTARDVVSAAHVVATKPALEKLQEALA